eukprot:7404797-Pyramimonas_sp.AAC.1
MPSQECYDVFGESSVPGNGRECYQTAKNPNAKGVEDLDPIINGPQGRIHFQPDKRHIIMPVTTQFLGVANAIEATPLSRLYPRFLRLIGPS